MNNPFWSPFVNEIVPYTPGEQPKVTNLIKLNTNENAYGVSPKVLNALKGAIDDHLKLYPDPTSLQLCTELGKLHNVDPKSVFVGNGSDEVIGFAFFALLKHEKPVLFPDITYSFYPVYCNLFNINYKTIPLTNDFEINLHDYEKEDCAGIVITNPNAPTGILLNPQLIQNYLKEHSKQVVIVDEAYIDFGGESVVSLINEFPNLLVVRTFSKFYGLAGLRVGYAVGNPDLIEGIRRVKDSFNSYPLDRLAQTAATEAVKDIQWSIDNANRIIANRDYLTKSLQAFGFNVLDSKSNFIFVSHPQIAGEELASKLREKNILIRHFSTNRIKEWLRITVGNEEECKVLIREIKNIYNFNT